MCIRDRFVNLLGMQFVPVPITGGPTAGQKVYFCIHETRVKDFRAFVNGDKSFDYARGEVPYTWIGTKSLTQVKGKGWQDPGFNQDETHPVTCVSWEDARAFTAWLSRREAGLTYRLPTDHEWSCAAGIGDLENASSSPDGKDGKIEDVWPWGRTFPPADQMGNYADSALAKKYGKDFGVIDGYNDGFAGTAPVMSYPSARSRDGLYDLGGNVHEWCEDKYNAKEAWRVLRGGSWAYYFPSALLSSRRSLFTPSYRNVYFGFRLVVVAAGSGG